MIHPVADEMMAAVREDFAECPVGCWEGDAFTIAPDFNCCYRCPVCHSPLMFLTDGLFDLVDDELVDDPIIVG